MIKFSFFYKNQTKKLKLLLFELFMFNINTSNNHITQMSYIPIFTPGDIGVPSQRINISNIQNPIIVSAYTGDILPRLPTFSTPTDDPTGKNPTYHGGILIGNKILCHQVAHNNNQRTRY
jgi:hypothetical protein